ncbi:hypothetical protein J6590_024287 [Homalodisca vitripennis]|nr:hypothetical protein J6590_024287 [Homalodisca vitripennis]
MRLKFKTCHHDEAFLKLSRSLANGAVYGYSGYRKMWVTAERSCPCKPSNCPANGGG